MAVEPSLIASREYSTWKRRPSGEKVLMPRSVALLELDDHRFKPGSCAAYLETHRIPILP